MFSNEPTNKKMKMDREMEMPPTSKNKHINDLPPENLGQILCSGLTVIDRLHCARVSRHWKWAVGEFGWTGERKLNGEIVFEGATDQQKQGFTPEHLVSLLRCVAGTNNNNKNSLVELDLGSFGLDHREQYFNHFLDQLERSTPQIAETLQLFQKLERLDIKYFDLADFVNLLPPNLRILKTWGPLNLQTLETLSDRCPKLKKVPFNRVGDITIDAVNKSIGKFLRLKRLNLRDLPPHGRLKGIEALRELEVLKLRDCEALDAETFEAMTKGCESLCKFSCRDIKPLKEESLFHLAGLPNLVEMEVNDKNDGAFTDSVLRTIARRGKLKRLETRNSDLSDHSIIYLIERCKSLVSLNVCGCKRITDRTLEAVVAEIRRRYGMPPRTLPAAGRWEDAIWDSGVFFLCAELTEIDERKAQKVAAENPWLAVDFGWTGGDPRKLC